MYFFLGKGTYNTLQADSHLLFQVLKDHNKQDAIEMAEKSYLHAVKREAQKRGIVLPPVSLEKYKETIQIHLTERIPSKVLTEFLEGYESIRFARLNANLVLPEINTGN